MTIQRSIQFYTVLLFMTLGAVAIGMFSATLSLWDDAYMFARYAHNVLHYGTVSWNPEGDPTFGLTSLLYLFVAVLPLYAFTENPATTMVLASYLSGCLFLILMACMTLQHFQAGPICKRLAAIAMLLLVTIPYYTVKTHFLTGMDTMFAMAYLTLYIIVLKWHEKTVSPTSTILAGVVGGLMYLVRPDLMLYALAVPGTLLLFSTDLRSRISAIWIGLILLSMMLVMMWFANLYFNSPVPLPFYAKGLRLYGDAFYTHYEYKAFWRFKDFIFNYRLLFALIMISVCTGLRRWWRTISPVERGLLMATIVFFVYHLFFVTPVMGMAQRFYYPALPAIIFLTIFSISYIISIGSSIMQKLESFFLYVPRQIAVIFLLIVLLPFVYQIKEIRLYPFNWNLQKHYTSTPWMTSYWFGLDNFVLYENDLIIATTEVGLPSVMHLDKTIIDLTGLNNTDIAHHGFSAETFFAQHHPDFIYLPHPDYVEMNDQILSNEFFLTQYTYFSAEILNADMGIALRQDSPYYPDLLAMVESKANMP
ncbi:MAG: hypothetical protein AAF639_17095 [Chloroflexota bacterium]